MATSVGITLLKGLFAAAPVAASVCNGLRGGLFAAMLVAASVGINVLGGLLAAGPVAASVRSGLRGGLLAAILVAASVGMTLFEVVFAAAPEMRSVHSELNEGLFAAATLAVSGLGGGASQPVLKTPAASSAAVGCLVLVCCSNVSRVGKPGKPLPKPY